MTLLVKQQLRNGSSKNWKLRSSQQTQTFGSSRLANLISICPTTQGIHGVFESKEGHWWYHDMSAKSTQMKDLPSQKITSEIKVQLGESELTLIPVEREENLYSRLEQIRSRPEGTGTKCQLFIAKNQNHVVDVKVLAVGKKFRGIASIPSDEWTFVNHGLLRIQQKTVMLEDVNEFSHLTAAQLMDDDGKKGAYVVLAAMALILFAALFGPKKIPEMTLAELPRVAQKIIVKMETKPKPPPQVVTTQTMVLTQPKPQKQSTSAPQTAEAPAKGAKVANMLKSISGGRISQLIGKVSSQAAKSANVVISNGAKAGDPDSGRALAALGNVEKSGRDWGSESGGKAIVVSTAGRGGGRNASGMGGLAAGGTGNAGVGLIEEESEIVGGLDREVIAQYIKSQLGQILYCYERQLSASPDLFGKVAVKFTIGGNGAVEQQLIGDTTLKNATVEGCILNRVASWKFPAPQGGTKVLVTYPFLFKSTN